MCDGSTLIVVIETTDTQTHTDTLCISQQGSTPPQTDTSIVQGSVRTPDTHTPTPPNTNTHFRIETGLSQAERSLPEGSLFSV